MSERESVTRILAVAFGVAFFCALLVSSAVYWLRPLQAARQSLEQSRAILVAAGVVGADETLTERDVINLYLAVRAELVDLDAGRVVPSDAAGAGAYDYRAAADDPAQSVEIPAADDIAGLGRRPVVMPVYRVRGAGGAMRIVVPVYGRGMWSTIHGFIGLDADLAAIAGVTFHEHGETAGIGDRIQRPEWLETWVGKRIYRADGTVGLRIGGPDSEASGRVDAITGATVTVAAVDRLVRYWFGPHGYGRALAALRAEGR